MKQLCPLILGILSLIFISCGGGSAPPNPPSDPSAVTVSVSPSSASLQINFTTQSSQQFLATVTNATNLAVTWQVNGVTGGNASVGTITPAGVYFTPAAVPSPNPVTVTAVSVADPTKSASASVTIMPPVAVSISPATPNVQFGGTQQFTATVQNNSNTAVTWQVNGNFTTLVGSISSSGLYTAPASGALYSIVVISATSAADPRQTAQATIMLTGPPGPNDSELHGQYVFSLKGENFAAAAHYPLEPKTIVGSFRADGLGNLEGAVDIVSVPSFSSGPGIGLSSHAKIVGAYTVGADGRGSLALFSTDPNVGWFLPTSRFALGTVVQGVATQGRIIEFDSDPVNTGFTWNTATGTIEKQDPSAFSTAAINGDFSFGFSADSFIAFAAVGRFHADGSGNISAGSLDTNELNGLETPLLLSNQSFTGSYGSVDGDGRGSAILVIPGVGTVTTAFYVVSNTELLFIGGGIPDNGSTVYHGAVVYHGVFAGPALRQTGGPYTNASLSGSSVFQLTGTNASDGEELIAGEFVADGKGNLTGVTDENINGSVSLNTVITGSYTIGANGRGTLTPQGGGEPFVLYMVSPGQAFLLHPPPGDPQIGLLQPQATGPFTNTSISGTFLGGTLLSAEAFDSQSAGSITAAGEFTFDGAGNGSGTGDLSASGYINSTVGYMSPDQPFAATYTIAANGRGTMTVTSLAGGPYVVYLISPTSFFTMYVGPITSINLPGLVFTK